MQIRPDRETCCGKQVAVHTSLVLAFWRHQLLILASGRPWWSSSKMVRTMDTTLHQWTTSPPEFLQIKGWKVRAFHTHSHQTLIRRLRKSNKNTTFPRGKKNSIHSKIAAEVKNTDWIPSEGEAEDRPDYTEQPDKVAHLQNKRLLQPQKENKSSQNSWNSHTHARKADAFRSKKKKKNSDLHQPKPPNRKIPR